VDKNKTLPVPVSVQGRTDIPYVLMSWPSEQPNLHAVDVVDAYNATKIFCFHFNQASPQATKIEANKTRELSVQKEEKSNVESTLDIFEKEFNTFI
jgi:hypothetical protein